MASSLSFSLTVHEGKPAYNAPDIEGVIKDGELHIVQTRPQM